MYKVTTTLQVDIEDPYIWQLASATSKAAYLRFVEASIAQTINVPVAWVTARWVGAARRRLQYASEQIAVEILVPPTMNAGIIKNEVDAKAEADLNSVSGNALRVTLGIQYATVGTAEISVVQVPEDEEAWAISTLLLSTSTASGMALLAFFAARARLWSRSRRA